jgi:hypothetical protein
MDHDFAAQVKVSLLIFWRHLLSHGGFWTLAPLLIQSEQLVDVVIRIRNL